jgi:hypothetical protein
LVFHSSLSPSSPDLARSLCTLARRRDGSQAGWAYRSNTWVERGEMMRRDVSGEEWNAEIWAFSDWPGVSANSPADGRDWTRFGVDGVDGVHGVGGVGESSTTCDGVTAHKSQRTGNPPGADGSNPSDPESPGPPKSPAGSTKIPCPPDEVDVPPRG